MHLSYYKKSTLFLFLLLLSAFGTLSAQNSGTIRGTIVDASNGQPIPGVNVLIENTRRGTISDTKGQFGFSDVKAGLRTLRFSFVGYKKVEREVEITPGSELEVSIVLENDIKQMSSIQVTSLRPDQISQANLQESDVQQANPRDSGELLRQVEGVDAVRRGPVGLDPVIRGLRETEVGTYLDGTRIFPGGACSHGFPA